MDKVSVITVCFNAEDVIEDTLKSVLEQDYGSIEYLIIDGQSQDRTLNLVEQYRNMYAAKERINCVLVSERDNGIYDAMNKGTNLATGKWVIFMNAGDTFYSYSTLSQVFSEEYGEDVKGIYGDTERFIDDWKKRINAGALEDIKNSIPLPFCHQSVFVRTEVMKELKYDITYRQAADYDFFLRCCLNGYRFVHRDIVVSRYLMGGVSEQNTVYHLKEKIAIRENNGVEKYGNIKKRYMIGTLKAKQKIKKLLPKRFLKRIRGY